MSIQNYNHLVEIDEEKNLLTIYRITETEKQLYTSIELPNKTWSQSPEAIKEFCQQLGENLIIDSPSARKLLGL
jgi:hypothetical protein